MYIIVCIIVGVIIRLIGLIGNIIKGIIQAVGVW